MYGNRYGLADDGTMWSIDGLHASPTTRDWIREIISECKLNITLKY